MRFYNSAMFVFLVLGLASGCGSDATNHPNHHVELEDVGADASGEAGHDVLDLDDVELTDSSEGEGKDLEDEEEEWACDFPLPKQGEGAVQGAFADGPARCGQPDYRWLDDASLGDVSDVKGTMTYRAALLNQLLGQYGLESPRPVKYDVAVSTVQYRTQDRGQKIDATALVGYPVNVEEGASPRDIVLILHGTAGFHDACAPSKDIESQALIALFASIGYVAVAPDYLGLKAFGEPTGFLHPYLVGEPTAIASIDAVRAAGKLVSAGENRKVCTAPRVAIVGGSQGGHAALWVDRIGPMYAEELAFVGGVTTVPPSDALGHMVRALQQPVDATGNTIAFLTAGAPWYGVEDRIGELLKSPYDVDVPEMLATNCSPNRELRKIEDLNEVFQPEVLAAAADGQLLEPWHCMGLENGLTTTSIERAGHDAPSYGFLFVLGENDELVHPPIERTAFETLCNQGMPLEYLECAGAKHTRATSWALPEIIDFVDARFAGEVFDQGQACQVNAAVVCRGTN